MLLLNPGFEEPWSASHDVLIVSPDGSTRKTSIGNIFTPPGWTSFYYHDEDTWDQPEICECKVDLDPVRVHSGSKAMHIFSSFRHHSAGLFQQVSVVPSSLITVTAWAHAWSNHYGEHTDEPRWSEGVGYDPGFWLKDEAPNSQAENFLFYIAVDPTGGTHPLSPNVVWSFGAHIYNQYAQVPPLDVVAQSDTVTIFLNSKCHFNYKHNDGYWDDVEFTVQPPPPSGYAKTVVLFHPNMNYGWVNRVVTDADWNAHRFTVSGNIDDATKGCAGSVRVIVLNPHGWDYDIENYLAAYYPWAVVTAVVGKQKEIGARVLEVLEE